MRRVYADARYGGYPCTPTPTSNVLIVYDDSGVFSTTVASCTFSVMLTAGGDGGTVASGNFGSAGV